VKPFSNCKSVWRRRKRTGEQTVVVNLHGYGATTYAQGNIGALERYILELEQAIARKRGSARRGIIRASF